MTRGRLRRLRDEWRPSVVTRGQPVYPLALLACLNAVDELDRSGFAVLLPDIRDHFDLENAAALSLVALTTVAVLLIEIPLSFFCDRTNRVRVALVGASLWALFSIGTGLATSVTLLVVARIGSGIGRAVNTPTHNSLISDWYEPAARVKVYAVHRSANSVGQFVGPLVAGGVAFYLGWRAPFFIFAAPTVVLVVIGALKLREPVRGVHERMAAGASADLAGAMSEAPESPWSTMKVLARIPTIRRVWMAVPFLGVALFGVPNLLQLIYEDVYDVNAAGRGLITAAIEPLQIVGIIVAMPVVSRLAESNPRFLLRFVAGVGVFDGILLVGLAYAPHVAVAIGAHALLAGTIGTLAPAFFAMLSLVSPPRVRSAAFSTMSVFAIPGIAVFLPLIGFMSDRLGLQASMVLMVPVSLAAGFILASAGRTFEDDIAAVRADSLARVMASTPQPG